VKPPRSGERTVLYRAVYQEFEHDPLPSRSEHGRFHAAGRSTSYLAGSAETAWKEVTHRWRADRTVYRMAEVEVTLHEIADLTDASVQKRFGIDEQALTADDYRICQEAADRLRAAGFEAIWTYSRADRPAGRTLVVLLDELKPGSRVRVRKVHRLD
jgi:RES domain-containing protein